MPGNSNSSDRDTRLAKQQEMIEKVVNWLKEELVSPQDLTHRRKDARYFGRVVTKQGRKTEDGRIEGEEGFHIIFSNTKLDSLTIQELIAMKMEDQQSYASIARTQDGILKQNKFYLDLQLALHQKSVFFSFEGALGN
jgi:hypothetical protein